MSWQRRHPTPGPEHKRSGNYWFRHPTLQNGPLIVHLFYDIDDAHWLAESGGIPDYTIMLAQPLPAGDPGLTVTDDIDELLNDDQGEWWSERIMEPA